MIISAATHSSAGRMPPSSNWITETPVTVPYRISGMLGGKIGPTMAEAEVTALAKAGLKPLDFMASISMRPMPPMSAKAEPDMPANTRLPKMLTCARPPGNRPTAVSAKR